MWSLSFYFWRCVLQFAGGEPRAAGQCGFDLGQASYGFNWLRNNYIVEREKKEGEVKEEEKWRENRRRTDKLIFAISFLERVIFPACVKQPHAQTLVRSLPFHRRTLTWPWRRAEYQWRERGASPGSAGPSSVVTEHDPGTHGPDTQPGRPGQGDRTLGWLASGSFPWGTKKQDRHTTDEINWWSPEKRCELWMCCRGMLPDNCFCTPTVDVTGLKWRTILFI